MESQINCGVVAKTHFLLQPLPLRGRLGVGDGAVSYSSHPDNTKSWIPTPMEDE